MGSTVSFSPNQGQPSQSEPALLDRNGYATIQIRSDCSDDLIQDRCQLMPFESFDSNSDDGRQNGTGQGQQGVEVGIQSSDNAVILTSPVEDDTIVGAR